MKHLFYFSILMLSACSSVPIVISDPPVGDVQLEHVLSDFDNYIGKTVRWGGKVIKVNNDEQSSTVQMLQFPVNSFGRPKTSKPSQGRFLTRVSEFLDPEIYKEGTSVTFVGKVESMESVQVDKKSIQLPVIGIHESHIWSDRYKEPTFIYIGHPYGGYYGHHPYGRFHNYGYYGRGRYYLH